MRILALCMMAACLAGCGEDETEPYRPPSYVPATCSVDDEGLFRCSSATIQLCENGKWVFVVNCSSTGEVCVEGIGGTAACEGGTACDVGDQQCDGNLLQTCDASGWDAGVSCAPVDCVETSATTAECRACSTGDERCEGNLLQTCDTGNWDAGYSCDPDTCVELTATTAECRACSTGDERCVGNLLQTCDTGNWDAGYSCDPDTCVELTATAADCVAAGVCTSGNQQCDGNLLQTCVNENWDAGVSCSPGTCYELTEFTAECRTCNDGDQRCSGNFLQTCDGGDWGNNQSCLPGICVEDSAITAYCSACTEAAGGTYYACQGTEVIECYNDQEVGSVLDCGNYYVDPYGTVYGWCYDYGQDIGPSCVFPQGAPCLLSDGLSTYMIPCGNAQGPVASMGCDYIDGCVTNVGACDPGTFSVNCRNATRLVTACHVYYEQAITFNCTAVAAGAGYCSVDSCYHDMEGEVCTAGPDYIPIQCESPLDCTVTSGQGTCFMP